MWKITTVVKNMDIENRINCTSYDFNEQASLPYNFRMLDDDGVIYFWGISDDCDSEQAFAPLDDLGSPDCGCTEIQYLEDGRWETL